MTLLREWWDDISDIVITFLIALILVVTLTAVMVHAMDRPATPHLPTGVEVADEIASLTPPLMSNDPAHAPGLRPLQDQAVG